MFIVKTRIYLHNNEYKRIVILSQKISDIKTQFLADKPLSVFGGARQYDCIHAVVSLRDPTELMVADELPELFCYLVDHGYIIDTNITQMYSSNNKISKSRENIICFVKNN